MQVHGFTQIQSKSSIAIKLMNPAAIGFLGGILLVIKIILHCWLLHKVGRFKILSPEDPSRLQLFVPIYFDVPKDIREFKTAANIIYTLSLVCFAIFIIRKLFYEG
jgi:hypothetical protein